MGNFAPWKRSGSILRGAVESAGLRVRADLRTLYQAHTTTVVIVGAVVLAEIETEQHLILDAGKLETNRHIRGHLVGAAVEIRLSKTEAVERAIRGSWYARVAKVGLSGRRVRICRRIEMLVLDAEIGSLAQMDLQLRPYVVLPSAAVVRAVVDEVAADGNLGRAGDGDDPLVQRSGLRRLKRNAWIKQQTAAFIRTAQNQFHSVRKIPCQRGLDIEFPREAEVAKGVRVCPVQNQPT